MKEYYKLQQKDEKYLVIFDRNRPNWRIYVMARHLARTTHIFMYLFLTSIQKRNNATVAFFLKFMSISFKSVFFTSLSHLNFLCFDRWATKTKLCIHS